MIILVHVVVDVKILLMTMYAIIAKLACAKWVWKDDWGESRLSHECYYCGQILETKEKLYDHLDVHSKTSEKQAKKRKKTKSEPENKNMVEVGESTLSEDEIIEQFNASKSGEPSRMSSKSLSRF